MARKRLEPFSMSFLDCMSCGFGAILLLFLILSSQVREQSEQDVTELRGEAEHSEARLSAAESHLARLTELLGELFSRREKLDARTRGARAAVRETQAPLKQNTAKIEEKEQQLASLQLQLLDLEKQSEAARASSALEIRKQGRRQYLTGLRIGGQRALILIDASASMLAEDIVNVLRLRNQSEAQRRRAPKWQRAVAAVEWLTATLQSGAEFQIYLFDTSARPALEGTAGTWLEVDDTELLKRAFTAVTRTAPSGGTSLDAAFRAIRELTPLPDNVYLLVDGLPTQGGRRTRRGVVDGSDRLRLMNGAMKLRPRNVPINVILFPMQGDPHAMYAYWQLARLSRGSLISPSRDWP